MRLKKLTALAMAVVMSASLVLTGCGKKTDDRTRTSAEGSVTCASKDDAEPDDNGGGDITYVEGESVLTLDDELNEDSTEVEKFDVFLNEIYLEMVVTSSTTLHFAIEHPENYGIDLDYTFGDLENGDNYSDELFKKIEDGLAEFDINDLNDNQRIVYELLTYECDMYDKGLEFDDYICGYFTQNGNVLSGIQTVLTEYSIQREQDAIDFIELLKLFPDYLEDLKPYITESVVDNNDLLTQSMYDAALDYADAWISDSAEENVIYVAFSANIKEAGLDEETEAAYLSEAATVIEDEIIPAIEDFKTFVEGFEDEIDEDQGLASFEGGKEYYAYLMEAYIGTGVSVDELYAYAEAELDACIERVGELANENPSLIFGVGESKYGDDPDEVLDALYEIAKEEFPEVSELNWINSYLLEEQQEDHVVAYYMSPQLDNIKRNVIRINGDNISDSVSLFTTLAHEGVPGHLYQQMYAFEDSPYEEINSMLSYMSYQEGWAVYIEKLAAQWCLDDETEAEYTYINSLYNYLFVTCADILVNYYGYTEEDFNAWMTEKLGYSSSSIYEFVVSDPGLYPCYGLGPMLVEDTLEELEAKGNDTKTSYDLLLDIGPAPFTVIWDELGIENPVKAEEKVVE